ncbi:hypothetical protein BDZ94DRAFT_256362 [Collybia nuda]|uniref:Uncharacterized protein n=1 Tax=Collybia nuda TaxID=64659 RepID=A0A9P5XTF9_9AGAR|nr:hypothetical protein BDZ94DRAFT_256362 [Collybia nuda]
MNGHQPHHAEPTPIDTEGGTIAPYGVYPSSLDRPTPPIPPRVLAPTVHYLRTAGNTNHPLPLNETSHPRDPPLGAPSVSTSPDFHFLRKHLLSPRNGTSLPKSSVRENMSASTNGASAAMGLLQLVKALRSDKPDHLNLETHAIPEMDFSILVEEVYRMKWELGLLRGHLSRSDPTKLLQFQEEARERVRQLMMRKSFNYFKPTTKPTPPSQQSPDAPHTVLVPPLLTDLSLEQSGDHSSALDELPMTEIFPSVSCIEKY